MQEMEVVPPKSKASHSSPFTYDENGQYAVGHNRESLIAALQEYRVANNLPILDPEADVDRSLGLRTQSYHPPISAGSLEDRVVPQRTFLDRVRDWLAGIYSLRVTKRVQGGLIYVGSVEANRRALICVACPKNTEWRNNCHPCVNEVERTSVNLSRAMQTKVHDQLKACFVTGHENRVAVWLDKKFLPKARLSDYRKKLPKFCWLLDK